MPSRVRLRARAALFPIFFSAVSAHATNGMNMEAWGARAGGMGGAAFAYDSGNSAVMNNPATLGLRPADKSEVGLGLTLLMPTVASSHPLAGRRDSDGNLYVMPTLSWIKRSGPWAYGAGLLAQGGMGTEYGSGSSLFAFGHASDDSVAPLSGDEIRSEVGVGRLMFPLAFHASDALTLAGQLDFVWATMDVRMDVDGRTLGQMMAQTPGVGSATGSLLGSLPPGVLNYGRFDFSDDKAFSGAAKGTGWAGKLGIHYKVSETLAVGATWHSKTAIDDLESKHATLKMDIAGAGTMAMNGKIKVVDFQWPETYGFGVAWQATPKLLLAGDVKRIRWTEAMKSFNLKFEADSGGDMTAVMEQNWRDQTVYAFGGEYLVTPNLVLRAGFNYGRNPVPDATLNPLFPATVTRHITLGFGWRMNKDETLAASLAVAPRVANTNPGDVTSTHRQATLRVNYNYPY